jgi:hypothetical protein
MNRVGAAVTSKVPSHAIAKFVEDLRQIFLRQIERASIDVNDPKARLDVNVFGLVFR